MKSNNSNPSVIVVPFSAPNAYAVERALAGKGIKVYALDHSAESLFRHSRRCTYSICPDPSVSEEGFIEHLITIAKRDQSKPVIFPTQDLHALVLCRNREKLERYIRYPFIGTDAMLDCVDKRRMYTIAQAAGLQIPETLYPINSYELIKIAGRLDRYPYILKPVAKFEFDGNNFRDVFTFYHNYNTKALRVRNRDELLDRYREVTDKGYSVIVQEEICGPTSNLWAIDFYADHNSHVVVYHTGCKLRQFPSDFGTCTLGRSAENPELIQPCRDIVRRLGFKGIGNIEFKLKDGKLIFLEINPRPWQWLHMATVAGVNIPVIAYADSINCTYSIVKQKKNAHWIDFRTDIRHLLPSFRKSSAVEKIQFWGWFTKLHRIDVEAIFSLTDPLPWIVGVIRKITKFFKRYKSEAAYK